MPAPATVDDFLFVLSRSKLLEDDSLDTFLRRLPSVPEEPDLLADRMVSDGLLTRFQVENLLKGKFLRFFIGPYKVLDRIGSGCVGQVYLCEHQRLRRRVAVKVLQGSQAQDEAMLRRFEREAQAAAALDHPNIVRAFDVAREDHLHYLVMEYVDGLTLKQLVQQHGPLPPDRAANYLRQAAQGLQYAHEAGLVHRDLKPSNLMVDRAGVVKVLDLGLARYAEDDVDLTRGAVLGSAAYMAPEQARDSHAVDARADIYSLGATFYLCLTGKRPQPAGLAAPESRPLAGDRGRLMAVLGRMMAVEPDDRYQTAAEVAGALTSWALPAPVHGQRRPHSTVENAAARTLGEIVAPCTRPSTVPPPLPAPAEPPTLPTPPVAPSLILQSVRNKRGAPRRSRWLWVAGIVGMAVALAWTIYLVAGN